MIRAVSQGIQPRRNNDTEDRGRRCLDILNSQIDRRYYVDDDTKMRHRLIAAAFIAWVESDKAGQAIYLEDECDLVELVNAFFRRYDVMMRPRFPGMP